ncbi:L-fucose:H+ symporter permease [Alloacidobacterium dinghuense]|uniref:L-fucose:H+ symporter permease n=1 Tax=Alloacidobacterium dinghuense TaxID=2763107 RepID=A0A7G8BE42_9BACT|nr:L-fucose:H+ symporter permease [Alloacidobacterium dinghuense]QNI30812.1 L-fucose:H+ symporter permease [Alloacidobacterium dinghuense]
MAVSRISTTSIPQTGGPLTERRYIVPLMLITSLFFLWAVGVNLNDILIPHLKGAFHLTDFESSFVQVAFFGGYFLAAWPAGRLMEKIGYQRGIVCGLLICACGAFLFIPAASIRVYAVFLLGLFVMACGQSFLEVSANPYVTFLGPPGTSEQRLNVAQSFNAVGAVVTPIFGSAFILSRAHAAAPGSEADVVRLPYMIIVSIFLVMALIIYSAKLPVIQEEQAEEESTQFSGIMAFPHLLKGVAAQFFYVGAQVGVASFVIRFVQHAHPGTLDTEAANYLKLHLLGFMIGRFAGSALMKKIKPAHMLAAFAVGCVVSVLLVIFTSGTPSLAGIVLLGFFHSIMFPTIFALSIRHLGPYTKRGSSLVVMGILGGAVFPALMGRISDAANIQWAFFVPLACYLFVLYFAVSGYKVRHVA